jgi:hypothetical protein
MLIEDAAATLKSSDEDYPRIKSISFFSMPFQASFNTRPSPS